MGVQERLSLEAVSADTLIASEHLHRYRLAAELCRGLRVLDLACGSGYGSAILNETAETVTGVDNDVATIDMAVVTVGAQHDIAFEAADALEFLDRDIGDRFDAIVCFEGLEHFADPEAVFDRLAKYAAAGMRLVLSIPNSKAFEEENEFHQTDYGYDEARAAFERLGNVSVLYQFLAEGSLIRPSEAGDVVGEFVLREHGEPEWANHFIACVNLDDELEEADRSATMKLAVAPLHNRIVRELERANRELWRENARIARERFRIEYWAWKDRERLQALDRLLATARHQSVERARERIRALPAVDRVVRAVGRRLP
jgi:SAM-dependent methyltransferase